MNNFVRIPTLDDPRLRVFGLLSIYVLLGITVLGFNRTPSQIALVVAACCSLDVFLHRLIKGQWLFPFSALITGLSLSILVNYAHGGYVVLIPVFFAIASKYLITYNGRHVFNPALFGIVAALLVGGNMLSVSPAYQWGGGIAMAAFIVTAAIMIVTKKINRSALIISFLLFYALALAYRAALTRYHVPPEVLFMGAVTSPALYLFTFFMITDPATSPNSRIGQILMAATIVIIDLLLHLRESLSTFFYAGFAFFALRWAYLHITHVWRARSFSLDKALPSLLFVTKRWAAIGTLGLAGWIAGQQVSAKDHPLATTFHLTKIPTTQTGLNAEPGTVLTDVDPGLAHIAKWILSIGDAVSVADVDKDGLQDLFLTYPLKDRSHRAALYRNNGDFTFERIPLPGITEHFSHPELNGLPSAALWFDADNDNDSDLWISAGFGTGRLLQNQLNETGQLAFTDITEARGLNHYTTSVSANTLDYDRDGDLDLMIGNASSPYLPDYDTPTRFSIFDLPRPQYEGDRRMFNIMHRTWHDADNGGENLLLENNNGFFNQVDNDTSGLSGTRWTIDIGTGDLNRDGWVDLYLANDFGPDELFMNHNGTFERIKGRFAGDIGQDTYKGMNASFADLDNNLLPDIYVSNVHVPLQAEGSLLWMNHGNLDTEGWRAFEDQASTRNGLNAHRFGWGAALGDINLDGRVDIMQANGMVDDQYDRTSDTCSDYWYWNEKIALTPPEVHGYADQWADLRGRCIFHDEAKRVLLNTGTHFVDVADQVGWEELETSRGIALVDLDNDGDLDALVSHQFKPLSVFRNDQQSKAHWIGLALEGNGTSCNRDALGTMVEFHYSMNGQSHQQYREVVASNGFSSQSDKRLHAGLGEYNGPVDISINWCGNVTTKHTLEPDQYHQLKQLQTLAAID